MTCEEFEARFLAGGERDLPANERVMSEQHLAQCEACRTLATQLDQLDAELALSVKSPALSADFNQRLARRLHAEDRVLSEAERAERKRQLQAEYEAGLARMRRASLRLIGSQEGLGYAGLAALAGGLAWQFTPRLLGFLSAQGWGGTNQSLVLATAAGVVFLTIGLGVAWRQTSRNQWFLR